MDLPKQSDLNELLHSTGRPCISIYLPTHRAGGHQPKENRVRLKRLISVVSDRLKTYRPCNKATSQLLLNLANLAEQESPWSQDGAGVAIFASPTLQRTYKLGRPPVEIASVGSDFYITPLLEHLDRLHYYVLVITRQMVRLFEGSKSSLQPVTGAKLPNGLADITKFKETERASQFRPSGGVGQDNRRPNSDETIYVKAIDEGVCRITDHTYPLILAATEPMNGLYRKYSRFPKLNTRIIEGNPSKLTLNQLHKQALSVINQDNDVKAIQTAALFAQLASAEPSRVSTDPTEIMRAAQEGQVKALLCLTASTTQDESHVFREHLGPERLLTNVYDDLADQAVRETLLHGGQAYALPADHFPAAASVAAVFRY